MNKKIFRFSKKSFFVICAPWLIRCALVVKTSKSLNLGFEKNRGPLRSPLPQPNTHTSFLRLALNAILFIFYSETLDKCQAAFLWAHVKVSSVSACKMLPRVSASSKNLVPSYGRRRSISHCCRIWMLYCAIFLLSVQRCKMDLQTFHTLKLTLK